MKFRIEDLKSYSAEVLELLERENITSYDELEEKVNEAFFVNETNAIAIHSRPSRLKTEALTLTYFVGRDIFPLELRLNKPLSYSVLFVKSVKLVPGYEPFGTDVFGNMHQGIKIGSARLESAIEKVTELRDFGKG